LEVLQAIEQRNARSRGSIYFDSLLSKSRETVFEEFVVSFIIKDMKPVSIVESIGFQEMIKAVSSTRFSSHIPSRRTLCRAIDKRFDSARADLKSRLEGQLVSLTTDCWTSRSTQNYLGITVHWIDRTNFHLHSSPLDVIPFPESHTAVNLSNTLLHVIDEWDLNVQAMTTDNAINIVSAMARMPQFTHIRCAAHTIQLSVTDMVRLLPSSVYCSLSLTHSSLCVLFCCDCR